MVEGTRGLLPGKFFAFGVVLGIEGVLVIMSQIISVGRGLGLVLQEIGSIPVTGSAPRKVPSIMGGLDFPL